MSGVLLSLRFFALYLILLGLGFVLIPQVVLPWCGFDPPKDFWVRVLGGILLILAYYYLAAARCGDVAFARRTVWGRLPLVGFYAGLVAWAGAPLPLLAVGAFESGCGVWTWLALRQSDRGGPGGPPLRGSI